MSESTSERERPPAWRAWMALALKVGTPLISVFLAVVASGAIIALSGYDPVAAIYALFYGAFGTPAAVGETLLRATPLLLAGLAVGYGFRAGLFNIGAEGQLFMGGLAVAVFGLLFAGLPWYVSMPLLLLLAALAGAAWAFVPGLLKAKVGAHEVITTMMFSYIARYLVSYLVLGPLKAPGPIPQTLQLPVSSTIPLIRTVFPFMKLGRAHMGFVLGVVLAVVIWLLFKYTTLGYEARAVGFNPWAAENGGISVPMTTIKSLCISGALAAVAGGVEVMGATQRLFDQFSSGYGFTGIAVALLAKNHPLAMIPAAILFGALNAGAGAMQLEVGVSVKLISIVQGLIIFFVAAEEIVKWFIRRRQKEAVKNAAG